MCSKESALMLAGEGARPMPDSPNRRLYSASQPLALMATKWRHTSNAGMVNF
jgi:hypothetical protein